MSYFERRMSLCHLAPTMVVGGDPEHKIDGQIVCQDCEKPCQFVPDFVVDDLAMELTLRRYKDGDLNFVDTQDILKDQIKASIVDLLGRIGDAKYRS